MRITSRVLPHYYDVIIIGSGVSGLTTAKSLLSKYPNGLRILIVEVSSTAGGRVTSAKLASHSVDMGAAWIHGGISNGENPLLPLLVNPNPKFYFPKQDNNYFSKLNPWTMSPPIDTLFCTRTNSILCMSMFQSLWGQIMQDLSDLALHVTVHYSPDSQELKATMGIPDDLATCKPNSSFISAGALLCALLRHEKYAGLSPQTIELIIWRLWNCGCWQADTLYRIPSYEFEVAPPALQLPDLYGPMSEPTQGTFVDQPQKTINSHEMTSNNDTTCSSSIVYNDTDKCQDNKNENPPHFEIGDYPGFHGLPQPAEVLLPNSQRIRVRYRMRLRKRRLFRVSKRIVSSRQRGEDTFYSSRVSKSPSPFTWMVSLHRSIVLRTRWKTQKAGMQQVVHSLLRDCAISPGSSKVPIKGEDDCYSRADLALNAKVHAVDYTDPKEGIRVFCQVADPCAAKRSINIVFAAKHVVCTIPFPALRVQMHNKIKVFQDRNAESISFRSLSSAPMSQTSTGVANACKSDKLHTVSPPNFLSKKKGSLSVLPKHRVQPFFYPELPQQKVEAFGKIHMGQYKKVFLLYEYQWWPDRWSTFLPVAEPTFAFPEEENIQVDMLEYPGFNASIKRKRKLPEFRLIENYGKMKNTADRSFPCLVGILVGDEVYAHDIYTLNPALSPSLSAISFSANRPCINLSSFSMLRSTLSDVCPEEILQQALLPYASLLTPPPAQAHVERSNQKYPTFAHSVVDSAEELVQEASRLQTQFDDCNATLSEIANEKKTRNTLLCGPAVERKDQMDRNAHKQEECPGIPYAEHSIVRKRLWSDAECVRGLQRILSRMCRSTTPRIELNYNDANCVSTATTTTQPFLSDFVPPEPVATLCTRWERAEFVGCGAYPHSDPSLEEEDLVALQQPIVVPLGPKRDAKRNGGKDKDEEDDKVVEGTCTSTLIGRFGFGAVDSWRGRAHVLRNRMGELQNDSLHIRGLPDWNGISLHFAGDCTDGMHMGSVHGAYLTGIRAAEEIIALYDNE